jgi:hypothetical protein
MIPEILQKGARGCCPILGALQPKSKRSNTGRNEAPNFIFRLKSTTDPLLAFTDYVWLLHHKSQTKVGTCAYVNPVPAEK